MSWVGVVGWTLRVKLKDLDQVLFNVVANALNDRRLLVDHCVAPPNDGQVSQEAAEIQRVASECLDGLGLVDSQVWLGLGGSLRE